MFRPFRTQSANLLDPVERTHPLNIGRVAWWLGLPGTIQAPAWRDIVGGLQAAPTNTPNVLAANRLSLPGWCESQGVTGSPVQGWQTNSLPAPFAFPITMGGWVKFDTLPVKSTFQNQYLICYQTKTGTDGCWLDLEQPVGSSNYRWRMSNVAGGSSCTSAYIWTADTTTWHHVIGVWSGPDNANLSLYIDGVAVTLSPVISGSFTPAPTSVGLGCISYVNTLYHTVRGRYDDLAIWNRALSATEIVQVQREGQRGYPETLRRVRGRSMVSLATRVRRTLYIRAGSRGVA